jgi:hypothetical protein
MTHTRLAPQKAAISWNGLIHRWQQTHPLVWIGTGIGFLLLVVMVILALKPAANKFTYSSADVVYGKSLQVIQGSDSSTRELVPPVGPVPRMELSEQFYDFGAVNSSQVVTRVFVIANQGPDALVIYQAYTTCGCTQASITASEIPPGKVALMTVRFDPGLHSLPGSTVRRGVILKTNDPHRPQQEIWIQATVK